MSVRAKHIKKCCLRANEDRISELPDDILVHLMSFFTLKEAGRTSVLSKRWKLVWSYIPTLNFDSRNIIYINEKKLGAYKHLLRVKELEKLVDQVIRLHKAPILHQFTVRFDFAFLTNKGTHNIYTWLKFAMDRRVQRLVMDFSRIYKKSLRSKCVSLHYRPARFTFPTSLYSSCNTLTSLDLVCVNVTGEVLESFLRNSPDLEQLSVKHSRTLVDLTISDPFLKLETLSISHCFHFKYLEISAPNLMNIYYRGPKLNAQFKSTPKLTQVSFGYGCAYRDDPIDCFSVLSNCISQIEVLSLSPCAKIQEIGIPAMDSVFSRLRKLDISVTLYYDDDLFLFGALISASPFLHHFKIQPTVIGSKPGLDDDLRRPETGPHFHLKIVEIAGFVGQPVDMEIVAFLIDIAVSLDKIILNTRRKRYIKTRWPRLRKREARMKAERFQKSLKPNTTIEIL